MAREESRKRGPMTPETFRKLLAMDTRVIEHVTQDILAAADLGDKRFVSYGVSLLADTIDGGTSLIRDFHERLEKVGRLGAGEEIHWRGMTPPSIVANMRRIAAFYDSIVKSLEQTASEMDEHDARDLDRRRIQNLREMAIRIQTGKMAILEKDPGYWTSDLEEEFRDGLEYRLSS